ncbi:unnamed protein product [Lymnaea stagnalis]|uniref:Band 7 domain-containing protein n=1 Tax=Lymnaea stagnalis TaxID=6523 RepID=A0AAV2IG32_LYMST
MSMASSKYTLVPMSDHEDTFDFKSVFTYNDGNEIQRQSYKSIFTYSGDKIEAQNNEIASELRTNRIARFFVMLGYFIIFVLAFPLMIWFSIKKVPHNERLVVYRLGLLQKSKGPGLDLNHEIMKSGLALVLPLIDRSHKVNVSLKAFSVPPKQIITGDKAIIEVGAEIYFQVVDAEKSVSNVQNLDRSTRILVQTALCNMLVQKSLSEIEAERMSIANALMVNSNKTCAKWGVYISRSELSQIKVLQGPAPKKAPTVFMPPGMFGAGEGTGALPSIFAQLAQAELCLTLPKGQGKPEAIAQALQAMMGGFNQGVAPVVTTNTNDLTSFLGSVQAGEQNGGGAGLTKVSVDDYEKASSGVEQERLIGDTMPSNVLPVFDPEDILSLIREALCESVVAKVGESYQFEISGTGAGTYYLDLKNGHGTIGTGPDPSGNPAAILSLTFEDLQAMLLGGLKPFQAFMSGRLRISGDTNAALKLSELGTQIKAVTYSRLGKI